MGKAEAGTPKALANKMKSKGLQKLRWFCQMCQKQVSMCRMPFFWPTLLEKNGATCSAPLLMSGFSMPLLNRWC